MWEVFTFHECLFLNVTSRFVMLDETSLFVSIGKVAIHWQYMRNLSCEYATESFNIWSFQEILVTYLFEQVYFY